LVERTYTDEKIIYLDVSTSTGQRAMNHEEGSYQLSHASDCFLSTSTTYCAKNRLKKWYFHSSDEDFRWKSKRQGTLYNIFACI